MISYSPCGCPLGAVESFADGWISMGAQINMRHPPEGVLGGYDVCLSLEAERESTCSDEFSDVSSDSDIFNAEVFPMKDWTTDEDKELERIDVVKSLLRARPLLPPHPEDAGRDYTNVESGLNFPLAHCAIKGCAWTLDALSPKSSLSLEQEIQKHVVTHAVDMQLSEKDKDFMAYYNAAIAERERENMPLIGPSIDRRVFKLLHRACNSETVQSLICFVCAQVKTHAACFEHNWDIKYHYADLFHRAHDGGKGNLKLNCSLPYFKSRFARPDGPEGNPFQRAPELASDCWEWRRILLFAGSDAGSMEMLCCPEDVEHCGGKHDQHHICKKCRVPVCQTCYKVLFYKEKVAIPMALCNDNFWGYTTSIITKFKVRWIEAAIVSPCWTSMVCFYVEGDFGHLMTEQLGGQRYRTMVKGSCFSVQMPWEDILESLRDNCESSDLGHLPRPEECLKYMLRLHLKVGNLDFSKHLRQVHVRPCVLIHLLEYLIDQGHTVFRDKGAPHTLKKKMRAAVQKQYPEQEGHLPEPERQGTLPPSILQLLQEREEERRQQEEEKRKQRNECSAPNEAKATRSSVLTDKNATPSDGPRPLEKCLEDVRPKSFTLDRSTASCSDPATLRAGALQRYGEINVQAGSRFIDQWQPKYFSEVLPFVIPRMVSGPDYDPVNRWRRRFEDAPLVSPMEFTRGFARRVEAQCRHDWSAVPIVRSVSFKHQAENTMRGPR